jgi:SP family myo-inositol transporter-like MFS transporter 13
MAGFHKASTAIYANVGLAATNFLGGFVGVALVERMGRRSLLLTSLGGVVLALGALGGSFYVNDISSLPVVVLSNSSLPPLNDNVGCWKSQYCFDCVMRPECGFCTNTLGGGKTGTCLPISNQNQNQTTENGGCSSVDGFSRNVCISNGYPSWISVVLLVLYLACFAPGMGPMPWTINSEIYPLEARSYCVGIATSVNWISNLAVSLTFLTLIDEFTAQGAFFLYAGFSLFGFCILLCFLPETKGLSLKQVVDLFRTR